jgi:hypothetical protein
MPDFSQLAELRYPFATAAEFFRDYLRDPAALHLVFAWIAAVLLILRIAVARQSWPRKLLALYFGLTLFNNFAFQILPGSSLGDIFGVLCAIYFGVSVWTSTKARPLSLLGVAICGVGAVFALHASLIGALYPELNADDAGVLRFLVISKVFVFGISVCLFDQAFDSEDQLLWCLRCVVSFALVGIMAYFIQAALLVAGTPPYGTYLDAGYVGFPSFGSVSLERGHFGKFLTPLYPLFLYLMLRERRRKTFLSFVVVTLINFSASSLSFFAMYVGMTFVAFRSRVLNLKVAAVVAVIASAVGVFVAYTSRLWVAVIDKVYGLAFQGADGGGRGLGTFVSYLETYPLGISYGGSTLRVAPGLDEINGGIFSFVSQLSFLSAPFIVVFAVLVIHSLFVTEKIADSDLRRALVIGILATPFIFAADVLWFVPTIWLPILLAYRWADIGRTDAAAIRSISTAPLRYPGSATGVILARANATGVPLSSDE